MMRAVLPGGEEGSFKFSFASPMTLSASVVFGHPLFSCFSEVTR